MSSMSLHSRLSTCIHHMRATILKTFIAKIPAIQYPKLRVFDVVFPPMSLRKFVQFSKEAGQKMCRICTITPRVASLGE